MLPWLLFVACTAAPPSVEPAAPTPSPEAPVPSAELKERLRINLRTGEAQSLSPLDGEVTLVKGFVDVVTRPDGRFTEKGRGQLRFTQGDETVELDFEEGRPFEVWGYAMAVFGGAGVFELSVFPHGEPPTP